MISGEWIWLTLCSYLDADTNSKRIVKWTAIVMLILLGFGLFAWNLEDIRTHEYACANPVYVQATIHVREATPFFSLSTYYERLLSYEYNGQTYQDVRYAFNQNPYAPSYDGTVITVAIDPSHPGRLVSHILNETAVSWCPAVIAFGLTLLVYGLAIENSQFREKRVEKANKRRSIHTADPDYLYDIFWIFLILLIVIMTVLCLLFPYTYGIL